MATKICIRCKKTKPTEGFYKQQREKDGLSCYCIECVQEKRKEQPSRQSEYRAKYFQERYKGSESYQKTTRKAHLKKAYGITPAIYEEMISQQKGKCAMCGVVPDVRLVVDHDHFTDKVRSLLCFKCNTFIGFIETSEEIMEQARVYLENYCE